MKTFLLLASCFLVFLQLTQGLERKLPQEQEDKLKDAKEFEKWFREMGGEANIETAYFWYDEAQEWVRGARATKTIHPGELIIRAPLDLVVYRRTICKYYDFLDVDYEDNVEVAFVFFLLHPPEPFEVFVRFLKEQQAPDLSMFWEPERLATATHDLREATEERRKLVEEIGQKVRRIEKEQGVKEADQEEVLWGLAMFYSRYWGIPLDDEKVSESFMVPVADLLNYHSQGGSILEYNPSLHAVEIVADHFKTWHVGQEVFFFYADDCTDHFWFNYGFVVDSIRSCDEFEPMEFPSSSDVEP